MFKNFFIVILLLTFSSSLAIAKGSLAVEKNLPNFLAYQKNVINIKNGIWNIKKDLREIAKLERWPASKLAKKVAEVESLREGLSYQFKRLREYEEEEFVSDFSLAKVILGHVEEAEAEVKDLLNRHHNMKVLFTDMDILIRKANNKVRQLYRIQKTIDDIYRSKRGDTNFQSDLLTVSFLKSRVRTQSTIRKISSIKVELEAIKKQRENAFPLFKHSHKEYDIRESEKRLKDLKENILLIIDDLELQIEDDNVTKKAIFLL